MCPFSRWAMRRDFRDRGHFAIAHTVPVPCRECSRMTDDGIFGLPSFDFRRLPGKETAHPLKFRANEPGGEGRDVTRFRETLTYNILPETILISV
jgi:hypothetical protein